MCVLSLRKIAICSKPLEQRERERERERERKGEEEEEKCLHLKNIISDPPKFALDKLKRDRERERKGKKDKTTA